MGPTEDEGKQRATSWPQEVEQLLEQVCRQILDKVGATSCSLSQWDRADDVVVTWITYARRPELEIPLHIEAGESYRLQDYPATAQVLQQRLPFAIRTEDPQADPNERAFLEESGQQALLMLPLIAHDEVIGLLEIFERDRPRTFSDEDIALAQTLANQTALVIEGGRLFQMARQEAGDLALVLETSTTLMASLDLETALQKVAVILARTMGVTGCAFSHLDEAHQTVSTWVEYSEGQVRTWPPDTPGATFHLADYPLTAWVLDEKKPAIVHLDDPQADPAERALLEQMEVQSLLMLPVVAYERPVGLLELMESRRRHEFSEREVKLAQALASQAAIAIENARLYAERERRITELSILTEIGQRLSSALELDQVTRAIYEQVSRIFDTTNMFISLHDEERREWETVMDIVSGEPQPSMRRSVEEGLTGHIIRHRQALLFHTAEELERFYEEQGVERIGQTARSWLGVPMVAADRVVGVIAVESYEQEHVYGPEDRAVLSTIAAQAAIAIENARLFQERARRITELSIVNEIGRALSSALELDDLLDAVHQQVGRVFDASSFYIATYQEGDTEWQMALQFDKGEPQPAERHGVEAGLTGHIIRTREPILLRTLEENIAIDEKLGIPLLGDQARCWMGVPLIAADEVVGVMAVQSYEHEHLYTEHDLALFSTIGAQAAIAIANARLFIQVQQRAMELDMLRDIGGALSSTLDVEELLEVIYQQTRRVIEASNLYIAFYDEAEDIVSFPFFLNRGQRLEVEPRRAADGLTEHVIRTRQPLLLRGSILDNAQAIGVIQVGDEPKAYLGIPILYRDRVLGVLSVQDYERIDAYDSVQIHLLQAVASQAAIALENARLYEESRRRLADLNTLFELGTTTLSTLDLQEVLTAVCREAVGLLDATSAYISEWNEADNTSVGITEYYGPEAIPEERVSDLGVVYEENPTIIEFMRAGQPYMIRQADPQLVPEEREYLEAYGGKSILYLPLTAREHTVGYIEVWETRYDRTFTEEEILLARNLASQAATTIENARLYTQIQEQLEDLRQASETQAQLLQQVHELSTPVIPIHDRVLVLPLIGVIDSERVQQITERLLVAVRRHRALIVLLDITGVPVVDTAVAERLLHTAGATRLLGAEVVVVGVRAEVAQALTTLGVDLEGLETRANLQAGIEYAVERLTRSGRPGERRPPPPTPGFAGPSLPGR